MAATATESTGLAILDTTQATQIVRGTIALTGTYGPDTLNLRPAKSKVSSSRAPIRVSFSEAPTATVTPSGYIFTYQAGTTPANGKLRITSAASTELTPTAAYSAALLQAVITYEAVFTLGI
jgi:hypothetical protein